MVEERDGLSGLPVNEGRDLGRFGGVDEDVLGV